VGAVQWTQFSLETVQRTFSDVLIPARPVANISVGLNHLFSGLDPAPYHWTNLVIHLAVGLALFWTLRLFQQHHDAEERGVWLALLFVFIFLVHPLNIQAVTYVIQRMTSLSTLFVLLGLASYIRGRHQPVNGKRVGWFGVAFLCAALAMGSKEIGYLLIPLLLLYEYCFFGREWRLQFTEKLTPQSRRVLITVTVIGVLILTLLFWQFLDSRIHWMETLPRRDFSGLERVLTQGRVQFFYLSLLLWPAPSRLSLDHSIAVSRGIFDPVSTAFALIAWAIIILFALRNIRQRPALAFPVLAYLLLHSMESAPVSLELTFEHRMYLNLNTVVSKYRFQSYGIIFAVGLLLSLGTFQRNQVWSDPLTFYRDCAQKSPNKWRPMYNLGTNLGQRGLLDEAKTALKQAAALRPDDSETHNQLANVLMLQKQTESAEEHYRLAVKHDPKNAEALYNLATLLGAQRRYAEQKEILEQFVQFAPPYLERQKQWALHYLRTN
jgi:hypothetical protein